MLYSIFGSLLGVSLAMAAAIGLLLCLRCFLKRRYAPRWRCALWMVIALRLLLPFTPELPYLPAARVIPEPLPIEAIPADTVRAAAPPRITPALTSGAETDEQITWERFDWVANSRPSPAHFLQVGLWVWSVGAAALAAWQIVRGLRFRRRARRWSRPAGGKLCRRLDKLRGRLGIRQEISLRVAEGLWSPMVVGLFHPVILLSAEDYADWELEAILTHEAIHCLRRDGWRKLLLSAACTLHWFNPLVWLMAREAEREIEAACDARAVLGKSSSQRRQYGRAILASIERQPATFSPLRDGVAFASGKRALTRRLGELFDTGRKRRGIAALMLIVAVAMSSSSLTACEWSLDGVTQTNEELVIWVHKAHLQYLDAFQAFQSQHPEIDVVVENYFDLGDSYDEYMQKLTTEFNAGKGPDIVFLDHGFQRASSVEKMMRGGVFADMMEFFEGFSWQDYNQVVMDAGMVDGKRYVFPLQYTMPLLLASREALDGFDPAVCTNFPAFLEEAERWMEATGGERRLFTHSRTLAPYFTGLGGFNCIDYDAGTADLSAPELRRAVEAYQAVYIQEQQSPLDGVDALNEWPEVSDRQRLFAAYYRENYLLPFRQYLCRDISYFRVHGGSVLLPVRNAGGGISAHIKEAVAVRANSANRKNAAMLIEYLLSEQVQGGEYRFYYPVYEPSLEKELRAAQSVANIYNENAGMTIEESQGIRDDDAMEILELVRQVDAAYFRSRYDEEFYDGFRPYWEGEKSYEDCLSSLESWFGIVATE